MTYNNILILFILVLFFILFVYPSLNEPFTEDICLKEKSGICKSTLCPAKCKPLSIDKENNLCSCITRINED